MKKFAIFFITIWGITAPCVYSAANDELVRYQMVRHEDVSQAAAQIESDPHAAIASLNQMLNAFYLEDISEKKIQQDQLIDQYISENSRGTQKNTVNVRRLIIRDLLAKPIKGHLVKEAPNLFEAHYQLAKAYLKVSKDGDPRIFQAAYHYNTAMRYRSLKLQPELYSNDFRLALLPPNHNDKTNAVEYKEAQRLLAENEAAMQKLSEQINVASDNSRSPFMVKERSQIESQLASLRNELTVRSTTANDIKQRIQKAQDEFAKAEVIYNRASADFLVETAMLLHRIENQIKDRSKILNRSAFERSSFNTINEIDSSENRNFVAFANLLESATKLDGKNPEITFALAEEYRKSRFALKAIEFYERTVQIQNDADRRMALPDQKYNLIHTRLGGLYFEQKKYIDAIKNYEIAYEQENDQARKNLVAFPLAKLHAQNSGNYPRAEQLFNAFVQFEEAKTNDKLEGRLESLKNLFHSYKFLGEMTQKRKNYSAMQDYYDRALSTFEKLDTLIAEQNQKIKQSYDELQASKKNLLNDTAVDDLALYYSKKSAYDLAVADLTQIEGFRKSLPLKNVYFALAEYQEQIRAIDRAIAYYQLAEQKGVAPDEARRHIFRLKRR